jgi:hypothetical protein
MAQFILGPKKWVSTVGIINKFWAFRQNQKEQEASSHKNSWVVHKNRMGFKKKKKKCL